MALPQLEIPSMDNLRRLSVDIPIILGSASPRRKDLLEQAQIPFRILTTDVPETIATNESPGGAAKRLAELKANCVAERFQSEQTKNSEQFSPAILIIAADTIVWHKGVCLGKPANESEAREMLKGLRGETHRVFTAVSMLLRKTPTITFTETEVASSAVTFKNVSDEEIERYLATGDPLDKAGAYGAQELGAFLVDRLEGALDTVIGFPLLVVDELAGKLLDRFHHG